MHLISAEVKGMTQSFWEPEAAEDRGKGSHPEKQGAPATLALSANDFSALEERILRAVDLVRRERAARMQAEERTVRIESQLRDQAPQLERLEKELIALRTERDQVKSRVERLLTQLDALEV
jgi:septal ring factor EnvC (AmiA/AmiB activator)